MIHRSNTNGSKVTGIMILHSIRLTLFLLIIFNYSWYQSSANRHTLHQHIKNYEAKKKKSGTSCRALQLSVNYHNKRGGISHHIPTFICSSNLSLKQKRSNDKKSNQQNTNMIVSGQQRSNYVLMMGNTKDEQCIQHDSQTRLHSISSRAIAAESIQVKKSNYIIGDLYNNVISTLSKINLQDNAIYLTYICSMVAYTLPVVLIPMIAADPFSSSCIIQGSTPPNSAEITGKIITLSSLAGGLGKIVNGFVCQGLGSRLSGSIYLLGLASFSFLLSTTSTIQYIAKAIAGMEFCASIMWTVCNVLIANKYQHDVKKLASAVTTLSLCSTSGAFICKIVGSALLSKYHWRDVARIATMISSFGAFTLFFLVTDIKPTTRTFNDKKMITYYTEQSHEKVRLSFRQIATSISNVLSSRLFWLVAAAHTCSSLGRSSEKIIGTFINDITQLPRHFCSSLSASVTLGLILGLGRKLESLNNESDKRIILLKNQAQAVASALFISAFASNHVVSLFNRHVIAGAIAIASVVLTASVAIQYYNFPPQVAHSFFGDDKAICISFIDAISFFMISPIWAMVSNIVSSKMFGLNNWTIAWLILSGFFALGGILNMNLFPVLSKKEKEKNRQSFYKN